MKLDKISYKTKIEPKEQDSFKKFKDLKIDYLEEKKPKKQKNLEARDHEHLEAINSGQIPFEFQNSRQLSKKEVDKAIKEISLIFGEELNPLSLGFYEKIFKDISYPTAYDYFEDNIILKKYREDIRVYIYNSIVRKMSNDYEIYNKFLNYFLNQNYDFIEIDKEELFSFLLNKYPFPLQSKLTSVNFKIWYENITKSINAFNFNKVSNDYSEIHFDNILLEEYANYLEEKNFKNI